MKIEFLKDVEGAYGTVIKKGTIRLVKFPDRYIKENGIVDLCEGHGVYTPFKIGDEVKIVPAKAKKVTFRDTELKYGGERHQAINKLRDTEAKFRLVYQWIKNDEITEADYLWLTWIIGNDIGNRAAGNAVGVWAGGGCGR